MSSGNAQLGFAIRAVNEANKAMKEIQQDLGKVEKSAKDADGAMSKMGHALGDVAKIAGGFVLAQGIMKAPGFFMDAAKAAAEDEAATARLEQALRNAGGAFDENVKKVNDRIAAGQKLAYSDDAVRDSFQTLLAATGDVDEALKRQALAMDFARGAGIPLGQASKLLGKVTSENVEAFKRMGITIGEGATEAEAFAVIQEKFAGQSETYAKSTAGQFEIMKIKMGEVQETIGAALLPVMTKVGEVLATQVVPAIEEFAAKVGPSLSAAGTFLQDNLLPPLQKLADWFTGNKEAMQAAGVAIGAVLVVAFTAWAVAAGTAAVATLLAMAPIIAIVAAVALLAAGIYLLVKHWDDLTAKYPAVGAAADAVKEKFLAFVNWIQSDFVPGVMTVYNATKEAIEKAVAFVKEHWETIGPIVKAPLEVIAGYVQLYFNNMKTIIETVIGVIKGIVDVFMGVFTGDWDRAWSGVKQIFESIWNGITGMIGNFATFILNVVPSVLAAGQALGGALLDGIKAALSATAGFAGDIGQAVITAVKELINSQVIDRINSALKFSFDTHIPTVGTIHIDPPDIPHLARGGIVTRPTLALIGESGPEAVIPLSRGRGAVGATEIHLHINAIDARSFEEFLNRGGGLAIDRHLRRAGLAGLA